MYILEWRTVFALKRGLFLCLFPELRSNGGNKHKNNSRVSSETVRDENIYIIVFLTRHSVSINDDKNADLYWKSGTSRPMVLMLFVLQCSEYKCSCSYSRSRSRSRYRPLSLLLLPLLHIVPVSHSLGLRSDDITIDCWWRPNNDSIVTGSHE